MASAPPQCDQTGARGQLLGSSLKPQSASGSSSRVQATSRVRSLRPGHGGAARTGPENRVERSRGPGVQGGITFILGHGGDGGLPAFPTPIRVVVVVAAATLPKGPKGDAWDRAVPSRQAWPGGVRGRVSQPSSSEIRLRPRSAAANGVATACVAVPRLPTPAGPPRPPQPYSAGPAN